MKVVVGEQPFYEKSGTGKPVRLFFVFPEDRTDQAIAAMTLEVLLLMLAALFGWIRLRLAALST